MPCSKAQRYAASATIGIPVHPFCVPAESWCVAHAPRSLPTRNFPARRTGPSSTRRWLAWPHGCLWRTTQHENKVQRLFLADLNFQPRLTTLVLSVPLFVFTITDGMQALKYSGIAVRSMERWSAGQHTST